MSDYLTFWRADGAIFLRPAGSDELYVPAGVKPLQDRLVLFCEQQQAVVLVTGEAGTGKSTLLKWLYDRLDADTHEVLITSLVRPERAPGWLTPRLAEWMGVAAPAGDPAALIRATAARLDDLIAEGRKLVVALDAAHLVETPEAFGEIAAYLNLQSLAGTCLSFVLCGDPGLAATVEATPALAARVAFSMALPRLTRDETQAYLEHRMKRAGLPPPFDAEAVDLVHVRSRGVYALINGYAENCLVEAFLRGTRRITADVARAAAQHLSTTVPRETVRLMPAELAEEPVSVAVGAAVPPPPAAPVKAPETAEKRADSASIKLSSLFKSDPGRSSS